MILLMVGIACARPTPVITPPVAAPPSAPSGMAPQTPSPMRETVRAHQRLDTATRVGERVPLALDLPRPVALFIPPALLGDVTLLVHFHGAAFVADEAALRAPSPTVAVAITTGSGSSAYERPFADGARFDSLLAQVDRALAVRRLTRTRVVVSGWSAGYGAIRALLRDARQRDRLDGVLLLDGLHASYQPAGVPLANGGAVDTMDLLPFIDLARRAVRGERRFVIAHSEVFPGTYASTTECSAVVAASVRDVAGRVPTMRPLLAWGPLGMQQLGALHAGRFEVRAFAGNSAPDHVDHLHALPFLLPLLYETP
ncbi:MAG: hypothetical protein K2X99_02510 [Gemmatimonadaceae bacterium]|nr:hypothetical protein [Gemmatimonadaceae bacterium]